MNAIKVSKVSTVIRFVSKLLTIHFPVNKLLPFESALTCKLLECSLHAYSIFYFTHFNIILPSASVYPKLILSLRISD